MQRNDNAVIPVIISVTKVMHGPMEAHAVSTAGSTADMRNTLCALQANVNRNLRSLCGTGVGVSELMNELSFTPHIPVLQQYHGGNTSNGLHTSTHVGNRTRAFG